jgi:hypothetical protein
MSDFRCGSARRGRVRVAAAFAAAALPFSIVACGDDDGDTAGPEAGTDVEDIIEDDQYFADDQFVGEQVTVSAEVEEVLTPQSFRLDGGDWGDESLLVVSAEQATDVQEDDVVQVTGTVRQFAYDDYANEYGLTDPGVYDPYVEEEFIEASTVEMTSASDSAPTS